MTVKSLWLVLKCALEVVDYYEDNSGKRIGIDFFVWLHAIAAAHADSYELRKDLGPATRTFTLRLNKLLDAGITPVFVIDGASTGAKASVNLARAGKRAEKLEEAKRYHDAGSKAEAMKAAASAIKITEEFIYHIVHTVLRPGGIAYLRAPGEADGQLVALLQEGFIDAIDTVDGDLIAHGATLVYSKVSYQSGKCVRYRSDAWSSQVPPGQAQAEAIWVCINFH